MVKADKKNGQLITWNHPGGKLQRMGSESLTEVEIIAILLGSGIPGRSAEEIAGDIMKKFNSFRGIAGQPLEAYLTIKGVDRKKAVKIMAAFEMAKRISNEVLKDYEYNRQSV